MSVTRQSPTLDDVARTAGVSPATVSRCLNSPGLVRPEIRDRVMAVVDELGYVPHGAARALASRRSRTVGAIFPSLESTLFGGTIEALQSRLSEAGYTLAVASSGYDAAREHGHVRNLVASGVDALVLVGAQRDERVYRILEQKSVPCVLLWVTEADAPHVCVGFDNFAAAQLITRYLLGLGHRRFALISGRAGDNDRAAARLAGLNAALADAGLRLEPDHLIESDFGIDQGRKAFRRLMETPSRPTAVVCGSEPFAYGAIFAARDMGLDVPGDVSIVGFDNMELAGQITPGLTTVQTPQVEMGVLAAEHLLARLAGEEVEPPPPLKTELIIRASAGPPPG